MFTCLGVKQYSLLILWTINSIWLS